MFWKMRYKLTQTNSTLSPHFTHQDCLLFAAVCVVFNTGFQEGLYRYGL